MPPTSTVPLESPGISIEFSQVGISSAGVVGEAGAGVVGIAGSRHHRDARGSGPGEDGTFAVLPATPMAGVAEPAVPPTAVAGPGSGLAAGWAVLDAGSTADMIGEDA